MNNLKFSLTATLIFMILGEKMIFLFQESVFRSSSLANIEAVVLSLLFLAGIFSFLKTLFLSNNVTAAKSKPTASTHLKQSSKKSKTIQLPQRSSLNWPIIIMSALLVLTLGFNFFVNFSKQSLDWDDVALYDARAHFLSDGVTLSKMSELTRFDFKNTYYYLLYPPFTSETHFLWYQLGSQVPISVLYSLFLVCLTVGLVCTYSPKVGATLGIGTALLVISQSALFGTSVLAYTNLPYTLMLSLGILLLYSWFTSQQNWEVIFGILLVSTSQWIRFLEPSWLAIIFAFFLAGMRSNTKKGVGLSAILFLATCILEYKTWQFFVHSGTVDQTIFQTSLLNFLEPIVGLVSGSFMAIFFFFIKVWGWPLAIHFAALFTYPPKLPAASSLSQPQQEFSADLFLKLSILLCICMYLAGLYFISFQVNWWPEMGGSLVRSSTFLLPLSIYLLVKQTHDYLRFHA